MHDLKNAKQHLFHVDIYLFHSNKPFFMYKCLVLVDGFCPCPSSKIWMTGATPLKLGRAISCFVFLVEGVPNSEIAQISYPKHTWSSVKIDHQIVNFGCRRIFRNIQDIRTVAVYAVSPGTCFHPEMIVVTFSALWLWLVGCDFFLQQGVFQWEPIRQVLNDINQGISLWFASGDDIPKLHHMQAPFSLVKCLISSFPCKTSTPFASCKSPGFCCSNPFLLQLVITCYYQVRSGVTFPDFPINIPRAAWVRQDSLSQARGPGSTVQNFLGRSHDSWDEKGPILDEELQ